MDEITETLQRICRKTNEADDSIVISCPDFKYVVNHFSDAVNLLYKENQCLRKALEDVQRYNNDEVTNNTRIRHTVGQIVAKALEVSE